MDLSTHFEPGELAGRLLDRIWREPGELGHRRVYADYLQAHGDPRGEFIALQLDQHEGRGDSSSRRRVRSLLAAHSRTWLGPLASTLTRATVFERGFLVAGRIHARAREHHVESPWWSTVESLANPPLALVLSPTTRSLRGVELRDEVAHDLLVSGARRPALERLELNFDRHRSGWVGPWLGLSRRYQRLLADASAPGGALSDLRELGFRFMFPIERERFAWLWTEPFASRLERVEVGVEPEQYLALDEWIEGLRSESREGPAAFVLSQAGFRYRIERGGGGRAGWSRLVVSGKGRGADLLEGLGSLRECEVGSVDIDEGLRRTARGSLAGVIQGLELDGLNRALKA